MSGPWHCGQLAGHNPPVVVCEREALQAEADRLRELLTIEVARRVALEQLHTLNRVPRGDTWTRENFGPNTWRIAEDLVTAQTSVSVKDGPA